MKPKIRKLWVEALRSGRFKKGRGQLKIGDRYCCLGVLSELYNDCHKEKLNLVGEEMLSTKVIEWAGFSYVDPVLLTENHLGMRLSGINDGDDKLFPRPTFKLIADLIEKHDCV